MTDTPRLTAEEIAEGRSLLANKVERPHAFKHWLYDHAPALLAAAEREARVSAELDRASGYVGAWLGTVAPQCEPLPTLEGMLTQLDNYCAGLRAELAEASAMADGGPLHRAAVRKLADVAVRAGCTCERLLREQMEREGKTDNWSFHNARCLLHQLGYARQTLDALRREVDRLRGFMKWLTQHGSAREMKDGGTAEEYTAEEFRYKDDFLEEFCDDEPPTQRAGGGE